MTEAEPQRVYVDAMNVIGSRPDGWWRDRTGAMARLVEEVAARADAARCVVVLDGNARQLDPRGVEVVWAPGGRDAADDEIVRRLAAEPEAGGVAVVTSDRALAARVRELGAAVVSPSAWRRAPGGS
ncbi:MAG TPA: DUF188 domain-containing protein [Baekduia sp.]|nr:DUF188 domain-containing protein [Baekduia sp.]